MLTQSGALCIPDWLMPKPPHVGVSVGVRKSKGVVLLRGPANIVLVLLSACINCPWRNAYNSPLRHPPTPNPQPPTPESIRFLINCPLNYACFISSLFIRRHPLHPCTVLIIGIWHVSVDGGNFKVSSVKSTPGSTLQGLLWLIISYIFRGCVHPAEKSPEAPIRIELKWGSCWAGPCVATEPSRRSKSQLSLVGVCV